MLPVEIIIMSVSCPLMSVKEEMGSAPSYLPSMLHTALKVGVHTIWVPFGQFKFVQKDHFQRNTNQSYISI